MICGGSGGGGGGGSIGGASSGKVDGVEGVNVGTEVSFVRGEALRDGNNSVGHSIRVIDGSGSTTPAVISRRTVVTRSNGTANRSGNGERRLLLVNYDPDGNNTTQQHQIRAVLRQAAATRRPTTTTSATATATIARNNFISRNSHNHNTNNNLNNNIATNTNTTTISPPGLTISSLNDNATVTCVDAYTSLGVDDPLQQLEQQPEEQQLVEMLQSQDGGGYFN